MACFALFGTVFWWHFVHDDPDTVGRRGLRRLQRAAATDGGGLPASVEEALHPTTTATCRRPGPRHEDPELAAYNAYLAALAQEDRPKSWRAR